MTADERREQVVREAITVFGRYGYEGATTDAIAKRVGVSQPYLFRLFPSKKDLFIAACEHNLQDTLGMFRSVAGEKTGHDALEAMGCAYQEMLYTNRDWLLMQLQTYAACHDEDIQRKVQHCLQELWREIETISGMPIDDRVIFFAKGMFCNVIAAAGRIEGADPEWQPIVEALGRYRQPTPVD
jgi:AcrR family transcriptional regulator